MNRKRVVLKRTNGHHFDPRAERIARSETPGGGDSVVRDGSTFDVSFAIVADAMTVGVGWLVWLLVGALGGLAMVLSAVAVGDVCRRRHRTSARGGPPQRPPDAGTRPVADATSAPTSISAGRAVNAATSSSRSPGNVLIGYVTVAADSDAGAEDESARAVATMCEGTGWELLEVVRDRAEGPVLDRPGLHHALERIATGEAQGLGMTDLKGLGLSMVDLAALMAWFRDANATIVAHDLEIDASTREGRHVANTLIALSARDHEGIGGACRDRAKGRADGRSTGRPAVSQQPELVERIAAMREANMTLRAIAEHLNAEGVPTLRGGKQWRPSSIQAALGYRRPRARHHLPSPHRDRGSDASRG
jgi:DNA invertase Pin-like site-specific DNA recombinase